MATKAELTRTLIATSTSPETPDDQVLLIVMSGNQVGQIYPLQQGKVFTVIGRDDDVDIQVVDGDISRRHAAIGYDVSKDQFTVADLKSRNGTRVNGQATKGEVTLEIGDKIELGNTTVMRVSRASEAEAKYARKMYQAVLRDGLTGIFNRRYLDDRLESELAYAKRHQAALTLLLADLDHFKRVNDDFGHRAGDQVLRDFAQLLASHVRTEDVVARYGGEEFAVVCRGTDEKQAAVLAERLRSAVEKETFLHDAQQIPVTVSIGIAGTREQGEYDREGLVEAADRALYAAKSAGRNCWLVAE